MSRGVHGSRSSFRKALEISLLLHLLLLFLILPRLLDSIPSSEEAASRLFPVAPNEPSRPLDFELVDLAEEREEAPVSPQVPLSDLDRRAHGGEGQAAQRPATRGNTPQLIQAEGGQRLERGAPPSAPAQPRQAVPMPQQQRAEADARARTDRPAPEGAGEPEDQARKERPMVQLPQPGSWLLPQALGGLQENPEREGGRVDEGGLSFDTQWYDWGPYAKAMLRKIRRNWQIPEIARLGVQGVVKIRFFIERDGSVSGLQILDESGKPPMDFAARDAIMTSSRLAPLPTDLTGVEREGVTITFFYNRHPPNRGEY